MNAQWFRTGEFTRLTALVVIAMVVGLVAPTRLDAQTAEIGELERRASEVADELDDLNTRVSVLDEEYNGAVLELDTVKADIARSAARVERTEAESADIRSRVAAFAVRSYTGSSAEALAADAPPEQYAARLRYVETAIGSGRDAMEQLRSVKLRIDDELVLLGEAESAAEVVGVELEERRVEIEGIIDTQTDLLGQVQGDLDEAVRAEQERRAREEAARAAEQERQREEAAARRQVAAEQAQAAQAARAEAQRLTDQANEVPEPQSVTPDATTTTASSGADSPAETTLATTTTVAATTTTTAPPAASPAPSGGADPAAQAAVAAAITQLGVRYQWGGESPSSGFDCSGLVTWAYRTSSGLSVPHQSRAQYASTRRISTDELVPGDLVFFGSPIHHVGMYVGGGQMIEAPYTGATVRYRSIYRRDLVGAGRVVG